TRRVAPSANRDAGGRRIGGVRRGRSARSAEAAVSAWADRSVADPTGRAMVSGAVCAVRSTVSSRALPDARAAGAAARDAGRGVRKAGCAGGGVFACGDRCRDDALSTSRGGRSRRRRSQAPSVGIQAGKTFKHLEKNQTTSAEQEGYGCILLSSGSNYFALLRTRLPGRNAKKRPDSKRCTVVP